MKRLRLVGAPPYLSCPLPHVVFPALQIVTQHRHYRFRENKRERSINPDDLLTICGFNSHDVPPSKSELAIAFRRELSKLMSVQRSPAERAKMDAETGMEAYVIEPDNDAEATLRNLLSSSEGRRVLGNSTSRSFNGNEDPEIVAKANTDSASNNVRADVVRKLVDNRIASLIQAYRRLSSSRYCYLYDSAVDNSNSVLLGYRRTDIAFSTFDTRRQEFFFSRTEPKPLADFSGAFQQATNLENTDVEQAIAESGGLTARHNSRISNSHSAAAAVAGADAKSGASVSLVLSLEFMEAFAGCKKQVSLRRREQCKMCDGIGFRRKKGQRCAQCGGRGRLQLPSGTHIVPKECSLCLGSGSVAPPECSGCKGTGLGAMSEHRAEVFVSPGARDGETINLKGAGHAGVRGGVAGNCRVTLVVKQHRFFNRDGDDLHVIVPVQLSVVLGGGSVTVPVLHDDGTPSFTSVSVVAPTTVADNCDRDDDQDEQQQYASRPMVSDSVILLPQYGMWRHSKQRVESTVSRGNLYVHCVGVTPHVETLTKSQRTVLLEHFTELSTDDHEHDHVQKSGSSTDKNKMAISLKTSTVKSSLDLDPDEVAELGTVTVISEEAFSAAKDLCRHWLP